MLAYHRYEHQNILMLPVLIQIKEEYLAQSGIDFNEYKGIENKKK